MSGTDLYARLLALLPHRPLLWATVQSISGLDAIVAYPGGATERVRNPMGATADAPVYVQDGAIVAEAPPLTPVEIQI